MRRTRRLAFLAALCAISAFGIPADLPGLERDAYIPLSQIKPGMKGVGRTAFDGNRIEEFPVEILGVLEHVTPGLSLIIGRAGGTRLGETGIIAGMSGSPVYVDGKLIGAISYSWEFSREPLAGITPIESMLEGAEPVRIGSLMRSGKDEFGNPVPIMTPLLLSGFDMRLHGEMEKTLSEYGFVLAASGGNSGGAAQDTALLPGSPVGVQLVGGDANVTAIGTVTYRDGSTVGAFGHPMMWAGKVSIPMTAAYVHTIVPSLRTSMKLASALGQVGSITLDTETGVLGSVGLKPSVLPLAVEVAAGGNGSREFHYSIARDRILLPFWIGTLTSSSFMSMGRSVGELSLAVELQAVLDDGTVLKRRDMIVSSSPSVMLTREITEPFAALLQNGVRDVELKEARIRVDGTSEMMAAEIEGVQVSKNTVNPGGEVEIRISIRPFGKNTEVKRVKVTIPGTCRPGDIVLRVGGGGEREDWREKRNGPRQESGDFGRVIEDFEEGGRSQFIFAELSSQGNGLFVRGKEMPFLPGSFVSMAGSPGEAGTRSRSREFVLEEKSVETEYHISGSQSITLKVRRQ